LILLLLFRFKKEGGGDWVHFFTKGKEAGFSLKETEMIRQLAVQCRLEIPSALFSSQNQLDKCIAVLVRSIKMSAAGEDQVHRNLLSRLYDHRKKIEIAASQSKTSIFSSHRISEGQQLRILFEGKGVFRSQVIKNAAQCLTIARPMNKKYPAAVKWAGAKISVYFWRNDDAGYVFDSEVMNESFSVGGSSIKITHGKSLFRTQKRSSVRAKLHRAAFLYLVPVDEPSHKLEMTPGLKCFLENISDTGCAVTVGGQAKSGGRVKVQFALDDAAICMTGTVRSVNYREDTKRSLLHIEAEPMPIEMRMNILEEVFAMMPKEDEDELPIRVLDDKTVVAREDSEDTVLVAAANNAENQ
jgi:c-di-GMP-binding flagellar brake protein YcgR